MTIFHPVGTQGIDSRAYGGRYNVEGAGATSLRRSCCYRGSIGERFHRSSHVLEKPVWSGHSICTCLPSGKKKLPAAGGFRSRRRSLLEDLSTLRGGVLAARVVKKSNPWLGVTEHVFADGRLVAVIINYSREKNLTRCGCRRVARSQKSTGRVEPTSSRSRSGHLNFWSVRFSSRIFQMQKTVFQAPKVSHSSKTNVGGEGGRLTEL